MFVFFLCCGLVLFLVLCVISTFALVHVLFVVWFALIRFVYVFVCLFVCLFVCARACLLVCVIAYACDVSIVRVFVPLFVFFVFVFQFT